MPIVCSKYFILWQIAKDILEIEALLLLLPPWKKQKCCLCRPDRNGPLSFPKTCRWVCFERNRGPRGSMRCDSSLEWWLRILQVSCLGTFCRICSCRILGFVVLPQKFLVEELTFLGKSHQSLIQSFILRRNVASFLYSFETFYPFSLILGLLLMITLSTERSCFSPNKITRSVAQDNAQSWDK